MPCFIHEQCEHNNIVNIKLLFIIYFCIPYYHIINILCNVHCRYLSREIFYLYFSCLENRLLKLPCVRYKSRRTMKAI